MRKLAVIAALALAPAFCLADDTAARDALIGRIENIHASHIVLTEDSPLVIALLASARGANPGVNETDWRDIAREVGIAISQGLMRPGGVVDHAFRDALAPLSDAELVRLEALLSDPVYSKYAMATASPAAQREILKAMMTNGVQMMNAGINTILSKHGLKEVR
jgi:hypothetical protein